MKIQKSYGVFKFVCFPQKESHKAEIVLIINTNNQENGLKLPKINDSITFMSIVIFVKILII